jgi:hypothetical protein
MGRVSSGGPIRLPCVTSRPVTPAPRPSPSERSISPDTSRPEFRMAGRVGSTY